MALSDQRVSYEHKLAGTDRHRPTQIGCGVLLKQKGIISGNWNRQSNTVEYILQNSCGKVEQTTAGSAMTEKAATSPVKKYAKEYHVTLFV